MVLKSEGDIRRLLGAWEAVCRATHPKKEWSVFCHSCTRRDILLWVLGKRDWQLDERLKTGRGFRVVSNRGR